MTSLMPSPTTLKGCVHSVSNSLLSQALMAALKVITWQFHFSHARASVLVAMTPPLASHTTLKGCYRSVPIMPVSQALMAELNMIACQSHFSHAVIAILTATSLMAFPPTFEDCERSAPTTASQYGACRARACRTAAPKAASSLPVLPRLRSCSMSPSAGG